MAWNTSRSHNKAAEAAALGADRAAADPVLRPRRGRPRRPWRCGSPGRQKLPVCRSFDGKWDALIENYNVFLRPAGTTGQATALSLDGSEGNYYTFRSIAWSPDSKKLVAYHTRPGYDRQVHYIESSPADQIQPKHTLDLLPQAGRRAGHRLSRPVRRGDAGRRPRSTRRCSRMPTT